MMYQTKRHFMAIFTVSFAVSIIAIKTLFVLKHLRFMPYGLDSLYYLGQIQSFLKLGHHDSYFNYRLGNIIPSIILARFVDLPPSQILILPYLTINLFSLVPLFFLVKKITSNFFSTSLVLLIYALAFIPLVVNDYYLYILVILPIRLLAFFSLNKNKKIPYKIFLYTITCVLSNFTYPILSITFDGILSLYAYLTKSSINKLTPFIFIIHLSTLLLFFGLVNYFHNFTLPFYLLIERAYSTYAGHISTINLIILIFLLSLFHLLQILKIFLPTKSIPSYSLPKLSKLLPVDLISKYLSRYFRFIALLITISFLFNLNLPIKNLPLIAEFTQKNLLVLLPSILFLGYSLKNYHQKFTSDLHNFTFFFVLFYFLFLISPVKPKVLLLLTNERFYLLSTFWSLILLPTSIKPFSHRITILSSLACLYLFINPGTINSQYREPGYTDLVKSADWLSTQPENTNNIVYAAYFSKATISPAHKLHSLYLVPSIVNYDDQSQLAKCTNQTSEEDCLDRILDYAYQNQIKYFIIESLWTKESLTKLTHPLPKPIYDQTVLIYNLK